jgi:hypothetical protein
MSVHVSSWAWKQTIADAVAKLVLLKLADNANDKGLAWPHQKTVARECECSERTVRRKVSYLKDRGLLEVARDSSRKGLPNLYRLPFDSIGHIGLTGVVDGLSVQDRMASLISTEPSIEPRPFNRTTCPECGVGAGFHVADCSKAQKSEAA